ncbi:MAG TPA: phosphodiester glycosidase family protein [Longimicrobiales bacterium]
MRAGGLHPHLVTMPRRSFRFGRTAAPVLCAALAVSCAAATPRAPLAPIGFPEADSAAVFEITPGVTYSFVRDDRGPWAIHILELDARVCAPLLEARKPGTDVHARAPTSAIAAGALAAINADFFMLPRGTPVGAHVTVAVPVTGPSDRPVFAETERGWRIGVARVRGHARAGNDSAAIAQVNRIAARTTAYGGTHAGITLFTRWFGDSIPSDTTARRVALRVLRGNEADGSAVVVSSDSAVGATHIAGGSAVLLAHGPARDWARRRSPGDTVRWNLRVILDAPVLEAVGGFPLLLRDGRVMLDSQTVVRAFRENRHPRTAVGWTPDERLFLLVVDGRRPGWSDGMSLDELTWLFQRLGASDALNLDGGGSSAMIVDGRLVNRTSDREGERAVGNALVVRGCARRTG